MQLRFTQMLAALRQAQAFLDEHAAKLVALNSGGGRAALNEAVENLAERATAQSTHRLGRRSELSNEGKLARALRRNHIAPLVRTARLRVPDVAQLDAVKLPPLRSNSTEMVTAALAIAEAVTPFADELRQAGLSVEFLNELRAAASAVLAAVASKGAHKRRQIGATEGIDKQVEDARKVVNVVDAFVRAALREGDPLVAEWASVLRTVRGTLKTTAAEEAERAAAAGTVQRAPAIPVPVATISSTVAPTSIPEAAAAA